MTLPDNIEASPDLTIITNIGEYYETSTTSPDSYHISYIHIPFLFYVVIAVVSIYLFNRLLLEFIIRWRQR